VVQVRIHGGYLHCPWTPVLSIQWNYESSAMRHSRGKMRLMNVRARNFRSVEGSGLIVEQLTCLVAKNETAGRRRAVTEASI